MGIDDEVLDVEVPAGDEVEVELPCSEIVGRGSLSRVGATAVRWGDGTEFENTMCVPAFLGTDYACGITYHGFPAVHTEDLDGDGDTEELMVTTESVGFHADPDGLGWFEHMGMGMH